MEIQIGSKSIGENNPCFIIAEVSANHDGDYNKALEIIKRAKEAGADAVKIQTYTPDTITLDCDKPDFQITQGTIWDGTTLHKLYQKAYTPWEWHEGFFALAKKEDIILFSTPFDLTSVDFLERLDVPAYKIASFEINDIPLIKKVAATGKPVIISTGVALYSELEEAVAICRAASGAASKGPVLLKCTSAYPTPLEEINLKTIPDLAGSFGVLPGISDHTLGSVVALGAVALGAKVVEKHITLDRGDKGVDSAFSMEPHEFKEMVGSIRELEKALGCVSYELTEKQKRSREHSRSLYPVEDIKKGELLTSENIRSIRPAFGLHTRHYEEILGKRAAVPIEKGQRLSMELFE